MYRLVNYRASLALLITLMLTIFMVRFVAVGWQRMLLNTNSADGDQGAYLQLGLDLREHGMLTDGTRNPLYPALLAAFAERDWRYFTLAKFLSLAFGLITILAVYYVGYRLFDKSTALLAAFLLSINMEFILHSSFVLAESLLVLCVLFAWFLMVQALRYPAEARLWILAGGVAGLAYLTKGTGQLIVGCFVLAALWLHGPRLVWPQRNLWFFLATYALVALPLWVYNWRVFGSPTFNFAITHQMWMDKWEENFVQETASLPTLWSYWQTHSWSEALAREWQGLADIRYFVVKMLWPTRSLALDQFYLSPWSGITFALFIVIMLMAYRPIWASIRRRREIVLLTALISLVLGVLFAWYIVIVPIPIRFLLPLLPILLLLIAAGLVRIGRWLFTNPQFPSWLKKGVFGVGCTLLGLTIGYWFVTTLWTNSQSFWQNPFTADSDFNSFREQPLQWVREGHSTGLVGVLWGPGHSLPAWRHSDRLRFVRLPNDIESAADFETFLAASDVEYAILDADMAHRRPQIIHNSFNMDEINNNRLTFEITPPGWALGLSYPDTPCQWCVLRRMAAKPPTYQTGFVLGEAIRLSGYDLDADGFRPGGALTLTLYWQSLQPLTIDYTIFTQLLGPDGQLYGQQDRQPVYGQWPTSRWRPGQEVFDKFVLTVNPAAPPGTYLVLVGLYDLNTGQRLPAQLGSRQIADNAIILHQLNLLEFE